MIPATLRSVTLVLAVLSALLLVAGCDDKLPGGDRTPPVVTLTAPADSADVSGVSFAVTVDADDDSGIERIVVRVDGEDVGTITAFPYEGRVITLAESAGASLVVEVEATDTAGNSATAGATVSVATRTVTRLTDNPADDLHPAWSPDGLQIAFQADRDGGHYDLWVMNADGTGPTRLTTNVNEDENPAWSPDGLWIAFDSDRTGNYDLWRLPLAGGEASAEALTTAGNDDREPAWNAGGSRIYFSSTRGTGIFANVWSIAAAGADPLQVTAYDADDVSPAIAPSGLSLAWVTTLDFGTNHVYTVDLVDATTVPLTGDIGFTEADPAWSPGGGAILFSRGTGLDTNLWVMPAGGDVPVQVTFGSGTLGDGGAAWSPDGSAIAFHSDRDGNPEIYVLE